MVRSHLPQATINGKKLNGYTSSAKLYSHKNNNAILRNNTVWEECRKAL